MKWLRGLGGWCSLGIAVVAIGGGAVVGKQYAEQNLLSNWLGQGARAQSLRLHWMHTAGCAEGVEIPLPYAQDQHQTPLQLRAEKMWFAYDQAALLRKRFILPHVIIQDAVISANFSDVSGAEVVDIGFESETELNPLVELPSESQSQGSSPRNAGPLEDKTKGSELPWMDQLQERTRTLLSDGFANGRQVAIDADMLSERMQAYFEDKRQQSNRLLNEARDIQQQLTTMDNVLRHEPQVHECCRRIEKIERALVELRLEMGQVGKALDEEQARVRSALLIEKNDLQQQALDFKAADADAVASLFFAHGLKELLREPACCMVLLSDLMNKPFQFARNTRGQQIRHMDQSQPEFAVQSTKLHGTVELEGHTWPFHASGSFSILPVALSAPQPSAKGNALWQMSIQRDDCTLQMDGQSAGPLESARVQLTSTAPDGLTMECQIQADRVNASGHLELREWLADSKLAARLTESFAESYRSHGLLRATLGDALVVNDQTPESLDFEVTQWSDRSDDRLSDWEMGNDAVSWLGKELSSAATKRISNNYQTASRNLEQLIAKKLSDQKSLVATLRKDGDQHLSTQLEDLRRLQAAVNSFIQQRAGTHFARQPGGDTVR